MTAISLKHTLSAPSRFILDKSNISQYLQQTLPLLVVFGSIWLRSSLLTREILLKTSTCAQRWIPTALAQIKLRVLGEPLSWSTISTLGTSPPCLFYCMDLFTWGTVMVDRRVKTVTAWSNSHRKKSTVCLMGTVVGF